MEVIMVLILSVLALTLIFHLFGKTVVLSIFALIGVTAAAGYLRMWWRNRKW